MFAVFYHPLPSDLEGGLVRDFSVILNSFQDLFDPSSQKTQIKEQHDNRVSCKLK